MNNEQRPIPGFPGYFACPDGSIVGRRGAVLVGWLDDHGYRRVQARDEHGRWGARLVHRLVAVAFLGPEPDGHEVNHINGIRSDARFANLEYVTRQENVRHSLDVLGVRRPHGEASRQSKLTEAAVREMRCLYADGVNTVQLGRRFGVSQRSAWSVVHRQTWSHVA